MNQPIRTTSTTNAFNCSNTSNPPAKRRARFPNLIRGKVEVIAKNGNRLMPCEPVIARLLLKQKKAKIVSKKPFTIKLKYATETLYMQERPAEDVQLINDIEQAKKEYQQAKKAKYAQNKKFSSGYKSGGAPQKR